MPTVTPFQIDLRRIASGILYMNLGRAAPWFPTSTKAHPSYYVQVDLRPPADPVRDPFSLLFPFRVSWVVWNRIIVPLFEDGSSLVKVVQEKAPSLRLPLNRIRLSEDLESLLREIEKAVLVRLEEEGFVPPSTMKTGYVAEEDGPLVYKRDTELLADQRNQVAAGQAYSAWETKFLVEPDNTFQLRLTGSVPEATPPPDVPDLGFPYDQNVVQVVGEPDSGEPDRAGTVELVYKQFDV